MRLANIGSSTGQVLPGGVTWLALGFDSDGLAAYTLQSARDDMGDDGKGR